MPIFSDLARRPYDNVYINVLTLFCGAILNVECHTFRSYYCKLNMSLYNLSLYFDGQYFSWICFMCSRYVSR